jgi:hypothetical protein
VLKAPSGPTLRPSPAPCLPVLLAQQARPALPPMAAAAPSTLASAAHRPQATAAPRHKRALRARRAPRQRTLQQEERQLWSLDTPSASSLWQVLSSAASRSCCKQEVSCARCAYFSYNLFVFSIFSFSITAASAGRRTSVNGTEYIQSFTSDTAHGVCIAYCTLRHRWKEMGNGERGLCF